MKKLFEKIGLVKRKREPFECPYDLKSCSYVDPTTATLDIDCKDCKRYNHGIRPNKW